MKKKPRGLITVQPVLSKHLTGNHNPLAQDRSLLNSMNLPLLGIEYMLA